MRWNFTSLLKDLDFADDIVLVSSKNEHCNDKLFACGAVLPALASSVNIGSAGWDTSRGREN